jgi:hypothetical protein
MLRTKNGYYETSMHYFLWCVRPMRLKSCCGEGDDALTDHLPQAASVQLSLTGAEQPRMQRRPSTSRA